MIDSKNIKERDSSFNTPARYVDDDEYDIQSFDGLLSGGDSDSDFANELNKNLENADSNDENEDIEDNNDDENESEDEISSDDALENERYLLSESIKDLELTIKNKELDLSKASNAIMKVNLLINIRNALKI